MNDTPIPADEVPTDMTLEDLIPSGMVLDDKQLLAFYRRAFQIMLARQNTLAKIVNALRYKELDRIENQSKYQKVTAFVGAAVLAMISGAAISLFGWLRSSGKSP